jgi:predicted regulator of Ras-like GTPase activity (Roadblock/LC7/MglB family)
MEDSQLILEIEKIITGMMEKYVAIKGISIGTSLATNVYTKLKPDLESFSEAELVAAATSFQYISKNLYETVVKNPLESTYVTVENDLLMLLIVKEISVAVILDRKLAELEGLKAYQKDLHDMALKIAALIETSDYIAEDPFVQIKRAIPSATMIAIISKEGMPIKVESQDLQEALLGSMIAAISNLTLVMLRKPMDYTLLQGPNGSVMVVQFDEKRVLAVAIPGDENDKIGQYLARIHEIVKKLNRELPPN